MWRKKTKKKTSIQNFAVFHQKKNRIPFSRSSHQRCSVRKVLRNFAKFTGKHLCHSLFFNKAAGQRPATLLEKTLLQVFSCKFYEISKNTFFKEHLWATDSALNKGTSWNESFHWWNSTKSSYMCTIVTLLNKESFG